MQRIFRITWDKTIDSFNASENRGTQVSHGLTYQKLLGKELMTGRRSSYGRWKCILQLRCVVPFKRQIRHHETPGTTNTFPTSYDKETLLTWNGICLPAIVKPMEAFDIYEIDLSDEDAAAEE